MTIVGVLHPGRMGAAVGDQLHATGARALWCPEGRSPDSVERAKAAGLEPVERLADLLAQADVVLSICPPAFAEDVASRVAAEGFKGIFAEANTINPDRALRIAGSIDRVVDGCTFGAPPSAESTIDLYLSGPSDEVKQIAALFAGTQVIARVMDGPVGKATALKMAQAAFQKVSRALAAVALALADQYDVREELLIEAERMRRSAMTQPDALPSVAARAWRWEPEMAEVAETLDLAALPNGFAHGAAEVFARWENDKDDFDITVPDLLERLIER